MLDLDKEILEKTGASTIIGTQSVQTLWSGYGEIKRYFLKGWKYPSVIVKHIILPNANNHRGWNTSLSHQRKLTSYQVERTWYKEFAPLTVTNCRVPHSYNTVEEGAELLLILEDLDAIGYHIRLQTTGSCNNRKCQKLTYLVGVFPCKILGSSSQRSLVRRYLLALVYKA
jgi:hypothetical protein